MAAFSQFQRIVTPALIAVCLILVASASATDDVTVEYVFEFPHTETVILEGVAYDRVTMEDAPNGGEIGHPSLPEKGAKILLPFGTEVESVEVVKGERVLLGSGYNVEPVTKPYKLSEGPAIDNMPAPDPVVYALDTPYPEKRAVEIGTQRFRGYDILIVRLQPVEFVPTTGELYYYPDLTINVKTKDSDRSISNLRGLTADELEVRGKVDNREVATSYSMAARATASNFDLLILTTPSLASSFQPLKDYHDTTGILTEIHTTSDVGSTNPDDVRDYIRERYINDGIQYLLIGADDNLIPAKDLYVKSDASGDGETELYMPGDIYFACLDGTYNYNENSVSGEPWDGEGGGDVDLVAEVYIGRASVGTTAEVSRFVNKTLQYLTCDDTYLFDVLMVGEHLGFGGVSEYAATMMDQNVDGSSADGKVTVGIPSDTYEVDRLYDRDWPGANWPDDELADRINDDVHIINHLGHGNPSYAMKFTSGELGSALSNDQHFFLYSQTCLAGHFDATDCWAEYVTIKDDNGAFAVVMNARYGWGSSYSTDGPSQRFNRQFWDAVFSPEEAMPEIGRANQDAKEDNLYRINRACMRWVYYESNLFGDPTVAIRVPIRKSLAFSHPSGVPVTVEPGVPETVEVELEGVNGGALVPGSVDLNYSVDGGAFVSVPMTEIAPDRYQGELPGFECGNTLNFYCSAEEAEFGVFCDPPDDEYYNPEVATSATMILVDNFELENGWTVEGDAATGHWERGIPAGDGVYGDPLADFDGSGQCFVTENVAGESGVTGGSTYLVSPTFAVPYDDAKIRYARWYANYAGENPHSVAMMIDLSNNDGANWTRVDVAGPTAQSTGGWFEHTIWISTFMEPTDQMKIRFQAYNYQTAIIEAGVDAVSVTRYLCPTGMCGDLNGDEKVTLSDVTALIDHVYISKIPLDDPWAGNVNGSVDGNITLSDITRIIDHVYISKGPLDCQ